MGKSRTRKRIGLLIIAALSLLLLFGYGYDRNYEGIEIYYHNGSNTRHLSEEGYNYGLRWQCVEFVKRYYYDKLDHAMPDTYGHAKDFFNKSLKDGEYNKQRGLCQYHNNGKNVPEKGDLIIFDGTKNNPYGHVAIVGMSYKNTVVIYQQNTRKFRTIIDLKDNRILGWLKSPNNTE